MSKLKKLVVFLSILVIGIPLSTLGYVYFKLDSMHDSSVDNSSLNSTDYKSVRGVTNILLVGTDGRGSDDTGTRSDSMMILTVDSINKKLKVTSLARDTYVEIAGRGTHEKLTHAYVYGGVETLIDTVESNLQVDIQHYAIVDFTSFMDIIDVLGGVTLTVADSEINETNKYINETYKMYKDPNKGPIQYIQSSGEQKLNAYQALSFARIRKNDSAYERNRRQRDLIQSMLDGLKDLPITKYPQLIDAVLPYVKTDLKANGIIGLGTKILSFGDLELIQSEFPHEDHRYSVNLPGAGYVDQFDTEALDVLHEFIFYATTDEDEESDINGESLE